LKTRYCFRLRGSVYSMTVQKDCSSLKEAKQWVREWLGVKRLPAGTEFWKAGFEF